MHAWLHHQDWGVMIGVFVVPVVLILLMIVTEFFNTTLKR